MIAVVAMRTPYEPLRIANARLSHFLEWVNIHRFYHCKNCVINNCFKLSTSTLVIKALCIFILGDKYIFRKINYQYTICLQELISVYHSFTIVYYVMPIPENV